MSDLFTWKKKTKEWESYKSDQKEKRERFTGIQITLSKADKKGFCISDKTDGSMVAGRSRGLSTIATARWLGELN
jgi:hypothetical protein